MSVRHPHKRTGLSLLCLQEEAYHGFYEVYHDFFFNSRACLMRYSETLKYDAAFTIDQDSVVRVRIFIFSSDVVPPHYRFFLVFAPSACPGHWLLSSFFQIHVL